MLHVGAVLFAFIPAGFAYFSALTQQVHSMSRPPCNEPGREGANVSAVPVKANAGHHHFNILFLQARSGAPLAGGNTGVEGI